MTRILLHFIIRLERTDLESIRQLHGPQFHRWLPNGKNNAIILNTKESKSLLKIWFERWGFVDKIGYIRFSYEHQDIDPKIISTQAILDAGPLMALLEINDLSKEITRILVENNIGNDKYIAFAKEVLKLIYNPINNFINILHTKYGQYWIKRFKSWDSREESIGNYCQNLNIKWSIDNGKSWLPFIPDDPVVILSGEIKMNYSEYLTENDWLNIEKDIANRFKPSTASTILSLAHELLDRGEIKHSFLESISALEIAIREHVQRHIKNSEILKKSVEAFWQLPLRTQIIILATNLHEISISEIENILKAIDLRNKIVHEGIRPPNDSKEILFSLFKTISVLLSNQRFKFPSSHFGNARMPVESWEKETKTENNSA